MTKILVAEDDRFLANAYQVKLKKAGFDIKICSDGEETLKALEGFKPDLMLLDLVMPVKDGFSVLAALKENSSWKKIPVIVASNLGQKEDLDKALALGAKDYIVKSSISLDGVVTKINNRLGI